MAESKAKSKRVAFRCPSPARLADALYNFHPQSGADDTYCRGLLVGVVSAMLAYADFGDLTVRSCLEEIRQREMIPREGLERFERILKAMHWD